MTVPTSASPRASSLWTTTQCPQTSLSEASTSGSDSDSDLDAPPPLPASQAHIHAPPSPLLAPQAQLNAPPRRPLDEHFAWDRPVFHRRAHLTLRQHEVPPVAQAWQIPEWRAGNLRICRLVADQSTANGTRLVWLPTVANNAIRLTTTKRLLPSAWPPPCALFSQSPGRNTSISIILTSKQPFSRLNSPTTPPST